MPDGASFSAAPALSAGFGICVYLIVKYVVLVRANPTHWGLLTAPVFFFGVAAILTMSISKYLLLSYLQALIVC
jgi:solute carrier family 20 (sodium-dependent phosphate transporter)